MNMYITSGTFDFLRTLKIKNQNENLILLHNANQTLLLQENDQATLFKHPRKYEVLSKIGLLMQEGFVAMNNIPVSMESRPVFENMIINQGGRVQEQTGFQAFRLLRPVGSETYIILTQWQTESAFNAWQKSDSFQDIQHPKLSFTNSSQKIFSGEAFVSKYFVPVFKEE